MEMCGMLEQCINKTTAVLKTLRTQHDVQLYIISEELYLSWSVFLCKIHLQVPVDELALAQTDDFHAAQI